MWLKQVTELTESRLLEDNLTSFCTCGWAEGDERHQSRRCFREPTRERLERRMSNFESLHLWQMYISGTLDLRILAHERWIQVLHWLHSIIALPANGFMQKHVTRSQESSSAKRKTTNSTIHTTAIYFWQWHTPKSKAPIYFKRRTNWSDVWYLKYIEVCFLQRIQRLWKNIITILSKNVCFFASLYLTVQWEKSRNCRIKSRNYLFYIQIFWRKQTCKISTHNYV